MSQWPFEDPPNIAVLTSRRVMTRAEPILLVTRDVDDGAWQFLTGGPFTMSDALFVGLQKIVNLDPSLMDLADLAPGWEASRTSAGAPWQVVETPVDDDDADEAPAV